MKEIKLLGQNLAITLAKLDVNNDNVLQESEKPHSIFEFTQDDVSVIDCIEKYMNEAYNKSYGKISYTHPIDDMDDSTWESKTLEERQELVSNAQNKFTSNLNKRGKIVKTASIPYQQLFMDYNHAQEVEKNTGKPIDEEALLIKYGFMEPKPREEAPSPLKSVDIVSLKENE